jgi:hypothetical protein
MSAFFYSRFNSFVLVTQEIKSKKSALQVPSQVGRARSISIQVPQFESRSILISPKVWNTNPKDSL